MNEYVRPPPLWLRDVGATTVAGGEVDEYQLTLRLSSDDLDPEEVSGVLGVSPTSARRRGEPLNALHAEGPRATTGMWRLKVPTAPGAEFEALVARLFSRLPTDPEVWAILRAKHRIELFCGVFLRNWNRGMTLSPALMRELSSRDIEIGLDIYAPSAESKPLA